MSVIMLLDGGGWRGPVAAAAEAWSAEAWRAISPALGRASMFCALLSIARQCFTQR